MSQFTDQCARILNDRRLKIEAAIITCALKVKRDSIKKTPSVHGTAGLRGTAFSRVDTVDGVIVGTVGYTSKYAEAVHESTQEKMKGKKRYVPPTISANGTKKKSKANRGTYWDNGESEFLKKAMDENANYINRKIAAALR